MAATSFLLVEMAVELEMLEKCSQSFEPLSRGAWATNTANNRRLTLLDWMRDVCFDFALSTQTMQLATHYMERFVRAAVVEEPNLQLFPELEQNQE